MIDRKKRVLSKIVAVVMSVALSFWLVPTSWADAGYPEGANKDKASGSISLEDKEAEGFALPLESPSEADKPFDQLDEVIKGDGATQQGTNETAEGIEGAVDELDGEAVLLDKNPGEELEEKVVTEEPPILDRLNVVYAVHVSDIGWQKEVVDQEIAGTTGQRRNVEAFHLSLSDKECGSISYSAYDQREGWFTEVKDGSTVGVEGDRRQLEAIKINLEGEVAQHFDVYYRVHVANFGWLGWTSNGEKAGSTGYSYAIEALEVVLIEKGGKAPTPVVDAFKTLGSMSYSAHVSNVGWQAPVTDGATAGTTGRSLAVEAIRIAAPDTEYSGEIVYSSHVADIGWMPEVENGVAAGTVGLSLQLEALKINLTGELAAHYDVYYRVHVTNYGWLDWASNGVIAGTTGLGLRVEAVNVVLVLKGAEAPGKIERPSVSLATVSYTAHVQNIGWQSWQNAPGVAGSTGMSLAIEGLQMKLESDIPGSISYRLHVQDIGWQDWSANGVVSGTTGRSLRAEAISVMLAGEAASYYDVYYRVHSQGYGWLGWAKNGESAGTEKCSYRMEALQVMVVAKGAAAPGSTAGAFKDTPIIPAWQSAMNSRANATSSATGWLLMVDTSSCVVGVYRGSRGNWTNAAFWSCAPGNPWTPTVVGQFSVGMKGYSFGSGYTCYYWTQFYGDYLFHSVLYNQGTRDLMDGTLGQPASLGCVRLAIENAKWIYDNIPTRSAVVVY